MLIRISSATAKVGVVVAGAVLTFFVGLGVASFMAEGGVFLLVAGLTLALVVFCGRVFRAETEPVSPARPTWKLSGGATSSAVLGVLFLAYAASFTISEIGSGPAWISIAGVAIYGLLAIAYFHSSVRQSRRLQKK